MVNKFERYLSSEFIEKQIIPLSSDSCKHTCNLDSENTFSLYTMTAVIIVNKIRSCEKRVTKKKCLIRKKKVESWHIPRTTVMGGGFGPQQNSIKEQVYA